MCSSFWGTSCSLVIEYVRTLPGKADSSTTLHGITILKMNQTEQYGVSVRLWLVFGRFSVRILAGLPDVLAESLCSFTQFFHVNTRIVPPLGYDCFLPNPFQTFYPI
jgi:hypothetical protein